MTFKQTLENHRKWTNGEPGGVRAYLQDAKFQDAALTRAKLLRDEPDRAFWSDGEYFGLSKVQNDA